MVPRKKKHIEFKIESCIIQITIMITVQFIYIEQAMHDQACTFVHLVNSHNVIAFMCSSYVLTPSVMLDVVHQLLACYSVHG